MNSTLDVFTRFEPYLQTMDFSATMDALARCASRRWKVMGDLAKVLQADLTWGEKLKEGRKVCQQIAPTYLRARGDVAAHYLWRMFAGWKSDPDYTRNLINLELFLFEVRWFCRKPTIAQTVSIMGGKHCEKLRPDILRGIRQAAYSYITAFERQRADSCSLEIYFPENEIIEYDWTKALQCMAKYRGVFLHNGKGYIHLQACKAVIKERFKSRILEGINRVNKYNLSDEHKERLLFILSCTTENDPAIPKGPASFAPGASIKWTKDAGQTAPKPLCIGQIVERGQVYGHVGYKGRTMLAFWMRSIGISKERAIAYLFSILKKENQGDLKTLVQSAWDKKMNSFSCRKIQGMPSPVPTKNLQTHGCPYVGGLTEPCQRCAQVGDIEDLVAGVNSPAHFTFISLQKQFTTKQ
jgi:DNA primase large subunit